MTSSQKGFSATVVLIVLVVIGLIGGAGWYIWQSKDNKSDAKNTPKTTQTDPYAGYLVIKEWGVKIKMKDAAKVTYAYNGTEFDDPRNGEHADSSITLQVKPEHLQDKSCKVGVDMSRYKTIKDEFFIKNAKKIGDHYFIGGGSPYNCGNDADNAINQSVRADFGNLEAL